MGNQTQPVTGLNIRVWIQENGPHPKHPVNPLGLAKFGDPSQNFGEATSIRVPDPNDFDKDMEIGTVQGTTERASLSMMMRFTTDPATLMRLARKNCKSILYAPVGKCGNPSDFAYGPAKYVVFPDVDFSNIGIENFGAFDTDESEMTTETADLTAREFCELLFEMLDEVADAEAVRELWTITNVDQESCGHCANVSDGCQRWIYTMAGTGATPGTLPSIIYTDDNGETWSTENISTMYSTEVVKGAAYIRGNLVLYTDQGELHWRNVNDLYRGEGAWSQTDQGFVAGTDPSGEHIHMYSVGPSHTWCVGDGGYVYFTSNPPSGVKVQDAGVATTQNLMNVHAISRTHALAVGELNAVIFTQNGKTWQAVTGPEPGITMNTCWMLGEELWLIGSSSGTLWLTEDAGATWESAADAGIEIQSTVTEIDHIKFVNEYEGYMSVRVGSNGQILRTITGGAIWLQLPDTQQGAAIPANDIINAVEPCNSCDNLVYGAGLDDDAATGMGVKASNFTPDLEIS